MEQLLSSPGMIAITVFVLIVEILSLGLLWLNMHIYNERKEKSRALLRGFENESALGTPGRFLIPLYVLVTLIATSVIAYLFIFQPHLL